MNIKEKAKEFAIKAHEGQVRKSEPEKPMIMHPIAVAKILEDYGYDDNVVAAGYLHDVVEDTKYTLDDIQNEFGSDIKNLVDTASEPDKSLSWEDRKKHTINIIKAKSFRNKLIVCADKINNIESLTRLLRIKGMSVFDCFKRGYESQLWYFDNVYESLIYNENPEEKIFKRLKEDINKLKSEIDYQIKLEKEYFLEDNKRFEELRLLHKLKYELFELKEKNKKDKPIVIEFTGSPRTGKTTMINSILDFFSKGGFKVELVPEFTTSSYYKQEFYPTIKHLSNFELNVKIMKQVLSIIKEISNRNFELVFLDRGIYDRLIWMKRALSLELVDEKEYNEFIEEFLKEAKDIVDILILNYADSNTVLKRDYRCHLSLEKRKFLNESNVNSYNEAMNELISIFKEKEENILYSDTDLKEENDITINTTKFIMKCMKDIYK